MASPDCLAPRTSHGSSPVLTAMPRSSWSPGRAGLTCSTRLTASFTQELPCPDVLREAAETSLSLYPMRSHKRHPEKNVHLGRRSPSNEVYWGRGGGATYMYIYKELYCLGTSGVFNGQLLVLF